MLTNGSQSLGVSGHGLFGSRAQLSPSLSPCSLWRAQTGTHGSERRDAGGVDSMFGNASGEKWALGVMTGGSVCESTL